jgi:nucleotide-binding universal stress UspA family protein
MRRILVPTDFSEESHKALRYGAALAREFGADLHVVHVGEIDYAIPGPAQPGTNPLTDETDKGCALRQSVKEMIGASIATQFHGRTGRAFDQIVRVARELGADLVVMSTHGHTALKRLFMGSNAERVVQHSSSPVLVVREVEREVLIDGQLRIKTILVPTDFSASSGEVLEFARKLGREFNARLLLFHAFTVPRFVANEPYSARSLNPTPEELQKLADDQMRDFLAAHDLSEVEVETLTTPGVAAEAIRERAVQENADLIITSTHGRTGLMHVLIGSVAEHVVRYARGPVLVVPGSIKTAGEALSGIRQ